MKLNMEGCDSMIYTKEAATRSLRSWNEHGIVVLSHGLPQLKFEFATFLISLCLGFLIWKMGKRVLPTSSGGYEDCKS